MQGLLNSSHFIHVYKFAISFSYCCSHICFFQVGTGIKFQMWLTFCTRLYHAICFFDGSLYQVLEYLTIWVNTEHVLYGKENYINGKIIVWVVINQKLLFMYSTNQKA